MRSTVVVAMLLGAARAGDPSLTDGGTDAERDAGLIGETVDPSSLDLSADPPGEWLAGDLQAHLIGGPGVYTAAIARSRSHYGALWGAVVIE